MCGIAAIHGRADAGTGRKMLELLEHRGPDDQGDVVVGENWLGHRRLSIVDVAGGKQPLVNAANDFWLVGNGEVYNHERLSAQLKEEGVEFHTASDNEVALHMVDRHGPAALHELNGMFAFVMAGDDGRFIAARDPVGIKPLYWAHPPERDGEVRFASEMAAFEPDWQPHVEAFPPGHYWTPEDGLVRCAWAVRPDLREPHIYAEEDLLTRTREVLVDAVERQMMGDVPVGVFLSGGLDSSLVAAIAQKYLRERGQVLKTFAVGLEGSPDLIAARAVSEYLGTEHHESVYTADDATEALAEVVGVIEAFDASLVRSAVPNHMLSDFTSKHVKVVLTGEGADELFAGYEYMREYDDPAALHEELVKTVGGLHNLNLQRCDRVTMAHGLEARVPFLDREVIDHALKIPPRFKLSCDGKPEKTHLRKAFEGWLPHEFLWRDKAQFGDGSGAASALTDPLTESVTHDDFERERHLVKPALRTREEVAYFRIFREHLPEVVPHQTLGRFATA